jgi:hypothetical protein
MAAAYESGIVSSAAANIEMSVALSIAGENA